MHRRMEDQRPDARRIRFSLTQMQTQKTVPISSNDGFVRAWCRGGSASHREVVVQTDGVVKYNNRGGAQNSGSWDRESYDCCLNATQ